MQKTFAFDHDQLVQARRNLINERDSVYNQPENTDCFNIALKIMDHLLEGDQVMASKPNPLESTEDAQ